MGAAYRKFTGGQSSGPGQGGSSPTAYAKAPRNISKTAAKTWRFFMILSLLSGTATLAAFCAITFRRGRAEQAWLQVLLGFSFFWLLGMLFYPGIHTQGWYVTHECLAAFLVVSYAAHRSTFSEMTLFGLVLAGAFGMFANTMPLTDHCAYRGLIWVDEAAVFVLLMQRGPFDRVHSHATIWLGVVFFLQLLHHSAWEYSAQLARVLGRSASAMYFVSMLMIARAAFRDEPGAFRPAE